MDDSQKATDEPQKTTDKPREITNSIAEKDPVKKN